MSGFIGCIHEQPRTYGSDDEQKFLSLNDTMFHRGPDGCGYYSDEHLQCSFRTLNTVDVGGGEPLFTDDQERYCIIFNGQIYNYDELRKELEQSGSTFKTNTAAELLLLLFTQEKEKFVEKLRGMFAVVIWDKEEQTLFGARDPFGMEPFFYYDDGDRTFFASEKKSILFGLGDKNIELNTQALQHYLTYQFVPEPYTLSGKVQKLEPGYYFIKKLGSPMEVYCYWKPSFHPVHREEDEWVKEIREVLYDSVKAHLRSDVPVGSFLSGGIDSTILASIAKEFAPDLKTFSVGFEREGFSEIDVAKETADKLGLENISYVITPEEYMNELPKIMWYLDDPLADPACVPLYFVAREASKHVKVAFSGEGSDEFFGGYNIYREPQALEVFSKIPGFVKSFLRLIARMMPEGMKGKSFIERGTTPLEERYIGNAKMFTESEKRQLLRTFDPALKYTDITKPLYEEIRDYGPVERMQYIDLHTWVRGDILLKADRMTMAHSIEVRAPFLDKKVFEVASKIPTSLKTSHGTTKYILRRAAEGIIPEHVLERKKLGFPVPIRHWLKNEMHDWAKNIIHESETDHLINKRYVLDLLEDHCRGKADYSRKIWTVLVFMVWHQVYVEKKYSFEKEVLAKAAVQI